MKNKNLFMEFDVLEKFMFDAFVAIGVPEKDAEICADVLITSDKRGINTHGIERFKNIYINRIKDGILNPKTKIDTIKNGKTTAVLDGNNGMGHVIGVKSMQMAIDKAKEYGMGMVAVRNSTHYGIAGYYVIMAVNEGMIGITGTNARPSIAPTFGVENMLGTNPLTFGLPTDEEFPFVFDCATSIAQRGKIENLSRLGKSVPMGWIIGKDGKTKTDANEILKGLIAGDVAFTPLGGIGEKNGGYKGYGFATVVEVLSAALQNGSYMKDLLGFDKNGKKIPYPLGHFFIAIDTNAFLGEEIFKKIAGEIMRKLRNSEKMPHEDRIFTAGEKEYEALKSKKGIEVDKKLMKQLVEIRDQFNLQYRFSFE